MMELIAWGLAAVMAAAFAAFGLACASTLGDEYGPLGWIPGFVVGVLAAALAAFFYVALPLAALWGVGWVVSRVL